MTEVTAAQRKVFNEGIKNPVAVIRYRLKKSFYEFFKYYWPQISNEELVDNWHIKYLCDELQKVMTRVGNNQPKLYDLIINIPPGTTKTSIISIMLPVWCWINWYWMRFITFGYSSALALESAETSRDLVRSEEFQKVFPEFAIKRDKDTKSNFKVVKKTTVYKASRPRLTIGGSRYSTSVGGTVTGFHGHALIGDDPLNPQDSLSEVKLSSTNRWMSQTLSMRKVDKSITPTILVMQRLHQNDPTGHMLNKNKGNVKHICLPAELNNYDKMLQPEEDRDYLKSMYQNNLLDPVRLNSTVLKESEQDLGQYGYAGQMGQNPVPPGGGMFKIEKVQVLDTLPNNVLKMVRYWDKAGTADGGAFTVGCKMAILQDGRYVVVDIVRGQWGSSDREKTILETAEADTKKVRVYIEREPGSGGKESAEGTIRNLAGFNVEEDLPTGDKVVRADPFSVQVNNGNVLLMRGIWNQTYLDELKHFPFSTYKDQVDASSGAFAKLVKRKRKVKSF